MKHTHILAIRFALIAATILGTMGCSGDGGKKRPERDEVTPATVQREIRLGMSGAEVIEALGPPNIQTTDEQRRVVWVWDRIATDSSASGGYWTVILGGQSRRVESKSQRTLTIFIYFDQDNKVRDFACRGTQF